MIVIDLQKLQRLKLRLSEPDHPNTRALARMLPDFDGLIPAPSSVDGEMREVVTPEGLQGDFIALSGTWHLFAARSLCWLGEEPRS